MFDTAGWNTGNRWETRGSGEKRGEINGIARRDSESALTAHFRRPEAFRSKDDRAAVSGDNRSNVSQGVFEAAQKPGKRASKGRQAAPARIDRGIENGWKSKTEMKDHFMAYEIGGKAN